MPFVGTCLQNNLLFQLIHPIWRQAKLVGEFVPTGHKYKVPIFKNEMVQNWAKKEQASYISIASDLIWEYNENIVLNDINCIHMRMEI